MMNLYFAWSRPLSDVVRPVGGLFYRAMFAVAGFNPVPFRMVCLAIGIGNMGLCWWFARLVSQSDRVAALAVLLFAFHSRLMEVWFRTAVVYDLLCFTFFYLAACLYIDARRRGRMPGTVRGIVILLFFLCALGSKEVAIALPVVLLAYEVLFERFAWRGLWLIATIALIDLPYMYAKTHGVNALTNNPFYRSEYSLSRFAQNWALFLNYLLILTKAVNPGVAVIVIAGLLAIALAVRSRQLIFAWLVLFACTLPLLFLPYRGAYVLYLAYTGWTLYAAVCLVAAQDWVTRSQPQYRTVLACVVFALVAWRWGKLNLHDQRIDPRPWLYQSQAQVHQMADRMLALEPAFPKGARILFLDDPFGTDEWTPWFIVKLLYRDDTLTVDRIKMMDRKPGEWSNWQYVFAFRNNRYTLVKPGSRQ